MAKFCRYCGSQITSEMKFCASCGTSLTASPAQQPVRQQPVAQPSSMHQYATQKSTMPSVPRKHKVPALIIFVSVLLILVSALSVSLSIVGNTAIAQIIDARMDTRSDSMPDSYSVIYEFFVGGERYTGSTTKRFQYGVRSDQTINVRYMPLSPRFNMPANNVNIIRPLVMVGIAILLLVSSKKGIITLRRKN